MALLSHLAATWHNRTDLAHGDSSISSISSRSSKRTSPTCSISGSTDTPDVDLLGGSNNLLETQGGGHSTTSKLPTDLLCHTTQSQGQQLQHQHQLQQPFPQAEPIHTHEDAVQVVGSQQEHSSCSFPRPAEGLPVVQPAHACEAGWPASKAQLVLQPSELATAVPSEQQQPAEASAPAVGTALDGVVHLTQQQLDYIMAEVEQLQHKLAQTTAKLDAVVAQPMSSQALLQQQDKLQQQHQQQQGSCVSLQIGDQPISEWHQQLQLKQQQLQDRQQQVLGLQQLTQQQQLLQRCNHKHRQCVAANSRRLYQQQQHHQQQQQQLCELLTPQCHPRKPSWNYQNPQVQQEQRQRRQLRRDAIRLRAQENMHLHQKHTAAGLHCTQENRPLAPQQQQQHRQRRQGQHAEMQHSTHQQQRDRAPQGSHCIVTAAATADDINAGTLETAPTAAVAATASSCLQVEGSWVSSADSSGQPAAAASAGAGPATAGLTTSQPTSGGSQAVASPAETVVFMQPICIRGPGVLHTLHG